MATSLDVSAVDNGYEYHAAGELIARVTYHSHGLYDVWPSATASREIAADYRMCHGLEAAEFYALLIAAELRAWRKN